MHQPATTSIVAASHPEPYRWRMLGLLGGRAADLVGARRLVVLGLGMFAGASLLAGLAPTGWALLVGRVLQGLAAAFLSPSALSLVVRSFEGAERDTAVMIAVFFLGSFYFQRHLGYDALRTGLLFLPVSLATMAGATIAGRVLTRLGPRRLGAAVVSSIAAASLAGTSATGVSRGFATAAVVAAVAALVTIAVAPGRQAASSPAGAAP
jgi:predicted MFS family arabinose efflux permease